MALVAVKIPPTWKTDLVTLRDSLEEEQGAEAISTLATLAATETGQELLAQLEPLAEVLRANPRNTLEAIAAVVEGEPAISAAPSTTDSTALPTPTMQGRPVPTCIAGMVAELVELAHHNPAAARKVLQEALSARVEPTTPVAAGVKFKLENPYLAADRFPNWQSGRDIKIPVDKVVGPWPEAQVTKLEAAIAARPKTAPGGRPSAQGATVLVRL